MKENGVDILGANPSHRVDNESSPVPCSPLQSRKCILPQCDTQRPPNNLDLPSPVPTPLLWTVKSQRAAREQPRRGGEQKNLWSVAFLVCDAAASLPYRPLHNGLLEGLGHVTFAPFQDMPVVKAIL